MDMVNPWRPQHDVCSWCFLQDLFTILWGRVCGLMFAPYPAFLDVKRENRLDDFGVVCLISAVVWKLGRLWFDTLTVGESGKDSVMTDSEVIFSERPLREA